MNQKTKSYFFKQKLWGLLTYQPRWGLTIKGWLLSILTILTGALIIVLNIHPFLAPVAPIEADALVIEGWIGDDGIKGAIAEFQQRDYRILVTVGTPLSRGDYLSEYDNFAQLSAATAIKLGFNPQKIATVPSPLVQRNRTLASAIAVKQWLQKNYPQIKAVNVYSDSVHSRRSWLLYKRALEPDFKVGIIAHDATDYEAKLWWTYSEGFRDVIGEAIAYIYAKFLS